MKKGDRVEFVRGRHPGSVFTVSKLTESFAWLVPVNRVAKETMNKHAKFHRGNVEANTVVVRREKV